MGFGEIYDLLATVLVLIAVTGIAVLLGFLETRSKGDLDEKRADARNKIRAARMERTRLMEQALLMFSAGNAHADSLKKLLSLYKKIDSEKKEIMWEEKYVNVMKAFIASARETAPSNMGQAVDMLEKAVIANEDALDGSRAYYDDVMSSLARYDAPPRKWIVAAGEKATGAVRAAKKVRDVYGENMEVIGEAMERDPELIDKLRAQNESARGGKDTRRASSQDNKQEQDEPTSGKDRR